MTKEFRSSEAFQALREKAEALIRKGEIERSDKSGLDLVRLSHELEVQRVELELQNEELRSANRQLEKSRNEYADLYQSAPAAFVSLTPKGLIEKANKAALRILADRNNRIMGQGFSSLIVDEDQPIYFAYLNKLSSNKSAGSCELRLLGTGVREPVYVQLNAVAKYDANGELSHWHLVFVDITERKKAETDLLNTTAKMSSIFRAAPVGIGVVSNRVIREVNDRFCEISGYSKDELIGQNARILYPDENEYRFVGREKYRQIEKFGIGTVETRFQRKDGTLIDVLISSTPLDENDHSVGITFTALDITERKKAEKVLRESEEKFSKTFYSSPSLLFICELETGIFIDVNDAYCAITGHTREEMIGRSSIELGIISERRRAEILHDVREFGRLQKLELKIDSKTGEVRYCLFAAETMEYLGKQCLVYSGVDITEREEALQALQESERRFRAMADGLPLVIWVHDVEGKQKFVNKTFKEFFGLSEADTKDEHWQSLLHPEDEKAYVKEFLSSLREQRSFHAKARIRRADGQWRWVESWGQPWFSSKAEYLGIIGTSADITEHMQAEEIMRGHRKNLEKEVKQKTAKIIEQYQQLEQMTLFVKKMAQHTIKAMENDRRALSKEIHDSIGGGLAAIKMLLETRLHDTGGRPPEGILSIERVVDHLAEMIKESKRISHQMRPMALDDFGLTAAISEAIKKFKEFYPAIEVDFQVHVLQDALDEEIKTVIYRVVQEALNNVAKHSGADCVKIELKESEDQILLKIEDNGCGFEVSNNLDANKPLQGYGIISMKERVETCKGTLQIDSRPGKGTIVSASTKRRIS